MTEAPTSVTVEEVKKFLDALVWGFLLVFAVPTVMIVASWNSLPGDPMYGVKLGLERTLLVLVSPSYTAKGTLEMKYTERRFSEAKRLLADKASVAGLVYLDDQVTTTKNVIVQAPNAKTQKDLAEAYIATLTTLSSQLEQQKQHVVAPAPQTVSQPISGQPSQRTQPQPAAAAPAALPSVVAAAEIAKTQATIQQAIVEMKQVAKEAEKQEEKNSNKGQDKDKKENSGNQENKDEKRKND